MLLKLQEKVFNMNNTLISLHIIYESFKFLIPPYPLMSPLLTYKCSRFLLPDELYGGGTGRLPEADRMGHPHHRKGLRGRGGQVYSGYTFFHGGGGGVEFLIR